jgi:hypothetical protein
VSEFSVLPAFLKSKKSTHYLYLAFDNNNNNGRYFKVNPNVITSCEDTAELLQGAAFTIECVKKMLDHPNEEVYDTIKLQDPPPFSPEKCKRLCEIKFSSTIRKGEKAIVGCRRSRPMDHRTNVIVLPPLENYTAIMLTASVRKLISIRERARIWTSI